MSNHWYTKYRSQDDTVHLLLDKNGNVTTGYPHLHVIFDRDREVRIIVTRYDGDDHNDRTVLPGDATGNEVNAAIERMLRKI